MNTSPSATRRLLQRVQSVGALIAYFSHGRRRVLLFPMLVVLIAGSLLLVLTGGLSYVAPFVYTLF
jgi:hypothetical protein